MPQKNSGRNRLPRQHRTPNALEIASRRRQIQSGWTQPERNHRRVDVGCPDHDPRFQAHLRFLQFLIERETQQS